MVMKEYLVEYRTHDAYEYNATYGLKETGGLYATPTKIHNTDNPIQTRTDLRQSDVK